MPAAGRRPAAGRPRFLAQFGISERAKPALKFQAAAGSPLHFRGLRLATAGCSTTEQASDKLSQADMGQAGLFNTKFGFKSNKPAPEQAASTGAGPSGVDSAEQVPRIPGLEDPAEIPGLQPSQPILISGQQAAPEPAVPVLDQPIDLEQDEASSSDQQYFLVKMSSGSFACMVSVSILMSGIAHRSRQ